MGNKLYVGNLPYSFRDEDLQQAFSAHGTVTSAKVMMERDTGRSKGFGFVEMGSDAEAQASGRARTGPRLKADLAFRRGSLVRRPLRRAEGRDRRPHLEGPSGSRRSSPRTLLGEVLGLAEDRFHHRRAQI